jgi:hypothetical protein
VVSAVADGFDEGGKNTDDETEHGNAHASEPGSLSRLHAVMFSLQRLAHNDA